MLPSQLFLCPHHLALLKMMDFSWPIQETLSGLSSMDLVDSKLDRARTSNENIPKSMAKPARKKFAVPPVKLACLECRASRTRCDGKTECTSCTAKGKSCIYTQSRRGGSRIRKRGGSSSVRDLKDVNLLDNSNFNHVPLSILPESNQGDFTSGSVQKQPITDFDLLASFSEPLSLVAPGVDESKALTWSVRLDFAFEDTDFMFDSIFNTQIENHDSGYGSASDHPAPSSENGQPPSAIRVYRSDQDILGAYYTYIHPYFPVLPPPEAHQVFDNPELGTRREPDAFFSSQSCPNFEPSTPISLAISATLTLIPHPGDPDPSGTNSVLLRREQAQAFAQSAFESIEIESELIDSTTQPSEALSSEPNPLNRTSFHPQNPIENESIIALLLLSSYEYAQRGNIAKMRNRAGQALNAAIALGLHSRIDDDAYFVEANRRVWWMTPPPVLLYDPRFTTPGPCFSADPPSWTVFLEAQQVIVSATQFVIDLDIAMKTQSTTSAIWDRMLELESIIEPLTLKADTWALESSPPLSLDSSELKVSQALRGIARIKLNRCVVVYTSRLRVGMRSDIKISARIKLHRYCAFLDIPIFTKKHCDLPPTPSSLPSKPITVTPNCSCSSSFSQTLSPLSLNTPSSSSPQTISSPPSHPLLPFPPNYSAKLCLKSALNIARSFQSLPYPQAIRPNDPISFFLPPGEKLPRTIPVFACCAMQASYAMIMLCFKTQAMGFVPEGGCGDAGREGMGSACAGGNGAVGRLLAQLEEGIGLVLEALGNYGRAYEGLGGMRNQIQVAAESVKGITVSKEIVG
ncbi:hypothetical protein HYALB_00008191 [Hymenoscyphus albidus]|uniref:Zn(2)-C6 fungal-type domain-containing protein n=1 Tax=Hymenoscyphus albidus TaxID=595503 RepID=A0A9N9LZ17_9HELO|nr:hypothetical protein HYALB_00008191 [Hymenoscyphus albidus]